jgi:hypothetical protein
MKVSDLKNYKDSLYSAFCRDISDFEKNFLLVSGGLLAFSITFIKEIIKVNESKLLFLLFLGWGLIILSIALMMFVFLKSAAFSDQLWKKTDDFIIANQLYLDETVLTTVQIDSVKKEINDLFYNGKKYLKNLRYYSVSAFIAGLVSFSLFVGINLIKEKKTISSSKPLREISIKIDSLEFLSTDSTLNFKYDSKINGRFGTGAKTDTTANP